ncbi:hypothetical protein BZA05DRAFT_390241 [Tricharina praecox]|uniref:uncharacterized protein n=1 Tax=Tricharina praecox TaxID=43433 RepID=UPI00221FA65E|nr:uncharacterized protein BZA05DRAFT_390241 [Tricharina praecox]KAI5855979.1 hypothetical protein BZA05DRAFT_390241 [Tricharina praecox]
MYVFVSFLFTVLRPVLLCARKRLGLPVDSICFLSPLRVCNSYFFFLSQYIYRAHYLHFVTLGIHAHNWEVEDKARGVGENTGFC